MADSEPRQRETRDVSGFSSVELAGIGTLKIVQGDRESLSVEAVPEMLEKITSEVDDGRLTLGLRKGSWLAGVRLKDKRILFELEMKEVSGIFLSGAGDVETGPIRASCIELAVSGAGNMRVEELTADELVAKLSGTGCCQLAGAVGEQDVTVSGFGSYLAEGLASKTAKALVSGAGDIVIGVRDTLDATVSGAGNIECHGDPTLFRRITGVGKITCVCDEQSSSPPPGEGGEGAER